MKRWMLVLIVGLTLGVSSGAAADNSLATVATFSSSESGKFYWIGGHQLAVVQFAVDHASAIWIVDQQGNQYPFTVRNPDKAKNLASRVQKLGYQQMIMDAQDPDAIRAKDDCRTAMDSLDAAYRAQGYTAHQRVDLLIEALGAFANVENPHRIGDRTLQWNWTGWVGTPSTRTLTDEQLSSAEINQRRFDSSRTLCNLLANAMHRGFTVMIGWNGSYSIRPPGSDPTSLMQNPNTLPEAVAQPIRDKLTVERLLLLSRQP